jgi:hypothetical protein
MKILLAGLAVLLASTAAGAVVGQDLFRGRQRMAIEVPDNLPYDGRVTFVRIRYSTGFGGFERRWGGGDAGWAHDYPTADIHVMRIINELTLMRGRTDTSNVFSLADPELHRHPIAYMSEPGYWMMDDDEVAGLRSYLAKGGFIIFDDFRGNDWYNLMEQMRRAVPDGQWVELDGTHPIFNSFFSISDPLSMTPPYGGLPPAFYGMFEDNDRSRRLIAIANVNNDLGEYWEFSETGYAPVDLSNQAYKFGINYFMYGLTH